MGRTYGFLSGVLFTSTVTYLSAQRIKRDSDFVCETLRESRLKLVNRNRPVEYVSNKIEFEHRTVKESFADLWNEEIIKGVNWVYSISWASWGEKIERGFKKIGTSSVSSKSSE